jgi:hypothetical protein
MEEENMRQHRDYLHTEEQRRFRAQILRPTIDGPILRLLSRKEKDLSVQLVVSVPTLQAHE